MHDDGFVEVRRELELRLEGVALHFARRMHIVVIEPRFPHCHHFRRREQRAHAVPRCIRPLARLMRMDAGGRREAACPAGKRRGALAPRQRFADHHDVGHAHVACSRDYGVPIRVERGVTEVTVGVD